MEYRMRDCFAGKKGIISNTHGFLSLYLDGSFQEKWNGYWSPSWKYLDYFSLKINGIWLERENLEEIVYSDHITFRYSLSNLYVRKKVSVPENLSGFKIKIEVENCSDSRKAVRTSLETGIDIRPHTKDVGSRDYSLESSKIGIKASKDQRYIAISSGEFKFEEDYYIKEHYPGEKQVCLVPKEIFWEVEIEGGEKKEAEIVIKTDGEPKDSLPEVSGSLKGLKIGRTFNYCLESLENLYYGKNSSGVIAGHPWFQNYWARDSFWTALGMIDVGMFREAEKILQNFSRREKFPSKIKTSGDTETDYPRCDNLPLFGLAAEKYARHTGEEKLKKKAEKLLRDNKPEGKIVEHDPKGTWMDTLERDNAIDIQSLWIESLERLGLENAKLIDGLGKFREEKYARDNLGQSFESINPSVPLMFGHFDDRDYLEKINAEFSSRYGARTRSMADPGYDSSGYHTGSVWGLTTAWAAAANLKHGNTGQGLSFLRKFSRLVDRNQLGALPEVVDAEKGDLLGADEQAWSAGMFVHVIDSYLLGIKVKPEKVVVDPSGNISCRRNCKKVRGQEIDLKVNNGEVQILNDPDLEVDLR